MNPTPCLAASQGGPTAAPARRPRLGYRFDPLPTFASDAIRDETLLPIDGYVLTTLLRFRQRDRPWCWTTKAVLASKLGRTPRTIQSSFRRLVAAGAISQTYVGPVDPDDAANRTGWRIVFPWLAGSAPGGRKAEVGGEAGFSGGEKSASPKFARVHAPLKVLDGPKPETTSSSSEGTDDDGFRVVVEGTGDGGADPEAVAAVRAELAKLGPSLAEQLGRRAPMIVEAAPAPSVSAAAVVEGVVGQVVGELKRQGEGIGNATGYIARALANAQELGGRLDARRIHEGLRAIPGKVAVREIEAERSKQRAAEWEAMLAQADERKAQADQAAAEQAEAQRKAREGEARAWQARQAEEAARRAEREARARAKQEEEEAARKVEAAIAAEAKAEWDRLPDDAKLAAVDRLGEKYRRSSEAMRRLCFATAFKDVFLPEFKARSASPPEPGGPDPLSGG